MSVPALIPASDFAFGHCVIQASARQLLVDGKPVRLGARAFDVLTALVERRNQVVSKNELLDIVWPGLVVEENNLQVQVSTLRKLLGPQTIVTIPGRGYQFFSAALDSRQALVPTLAAVAASAPTLSLGHLPAQLPPLLGRDTELAALALLLQGNHAQRLITITGAGGMGKTRLAQAAALAAHQDKANYPDGVWWVEFAPVSDCHLLLGSIARQLSMVLDPDATAEQLAARIADRQMLIVLDNCEHLIGHIAALAATLLRAVPQLTLLATSQESLKLPDEQVLRLGTLTLPLDGALDSRAPSETSEAGELSDERFGALAMFTARARAATPQFVLNDDNRAAVIEICRRLDGIPLAIEFAAARLPLLGIEGVRLRLDDRFRLLTGGARLAPQRYRLLESARAFARERMELANESAAAARHLADAVHKIFDTCHGARWSTDSAALLAAALPDIDNLRAALNWASGETGDAVHLAALVGASEWFWRPADLKAEGMRWFELAVHRITADTPPSVEARLMRGYAALAQQAAAHKEIPALQRAAALYRATADGPGLYETLVTLAQKQVWARDFDGAQASITQADALFDPAWPALMREGQLAACTYLFEVTGRPADGEPLMRELVALMRASGDARKLDFALMNLAENLFIQGKVGEAVSVRREVVRRIGGRRVSYAGNNLGNLCAALVFNDELDEALQAARASIAPLQRSGEPYIHADHFALLACKLGWHATAARLHGRVNANVQASGFEREASELRAARTTIDALSEAFPADVLQRLLAEGVALSDEAAIRMALGVDRRGAERAA